MREDVTRCSDCPWEGASARYTPVSLFHLYQGKDEVHTVHTYRGLPIGALK